MSFRWRTGDESDEPLELRRQPAPGRPRQRRLLALLGLLVLLSIGVFFGWRNLRQRAEANEARIEEDVLAIHALAQDAVAAGDDELYFSLLPPQSPSWAETQKLLLQENLLFDGAVRLYDLVPLAGHRGAPEVALNPTLSHATVFTQQSFAYTNTARLAEAVTLRQMQTYSLGASGWQVAPPPPTFWSPEIIVPGPPITLHYPQRDEAIALRLLAELERLLPEMCTLPGLDCPADLHVTLRLAADPFALSQATDPEALLRGSWTVTLPTPSLGGIPVDEHGEKLVVRSLAVRALGPLISQAAGYDCCAGSALARAIVERQLYHLNVLAWPLTPDHYEALMQEGLELGHALVLQRREAAALTPGARRQTLALAEFLEESLPAGAPLSNLQLSVRAWSNQADEPGQFMTQWAEFTYARSRSAQLAASVDLSPPGTVQLTCYENDGLAILHYDFGQAAWKHRLTYSSAEMWTVDSVVPLPGDYGFIIKEVIPAREEPQVARYVWRHAGGATMLFETAPGDEGVPLFAPYDGSAPHWRYTLLGPDPPNLRQSLEEDWWRIDLNVCTNGDCEVQPHVMRPRWSPDGTKLLLEASLSGATLDPHARTLFRAGARAQNAAPLGSGYAPIWLGNAQYAYLRESPENTGQELIVAAANGDRSLVVATVEDFATHLEDSQQEGQRLQLVGLQENPTDPQRLFLQGAIDQQDGDNQPDTYLFTVQLSPEMREVTGIELLAHSSRPIPSRLSPNGRWLALTDFNDWQLYDLYSDQVTSLGQGSPPVWSPDGEWLVQMHSNNILLHNPDLGYKRSIVQDLANCTFSSLHWH